MRLRFPNRELADLELCPGVHAIGCDSDGLPGLVDDAASAFAQFCVDRRGVWLQLHDGVRGVHVNGRPVRRMAMLRAGDCVYLNGVELLLLGDAPQAPSMDPVRDMHAPRMVLRGMGGQHHGRCFSLEVPRRVGRAADCDIRLPETIFADQHALFEPRGDGAGVRALGDSAGILINGHMVHDALLRPGDQVVFDAQHRFAVESPKIAGAVSEASTADDADDALAMAGSLAGFAQPSSIRRMPWLLLAALMLSMALSLLLLYGAR